MNADMTAAPGVFDRESGVTDLWWPFGGTTGRYTTKVSGEQTDGRLMQVLIRDYRGAATPLHVHRDADETFHVIEGSLAVFIGGERFDLGPGDFVLGPKGIPHAFVVTSERAEFLVTCAGAGVSGPAGYGIDGFFREVAPAIVEGEPRPEPRRPDPEVFATRMDAYGIDLVGPPPTI